MIVMVGGPKHGTRCTLTDLSSDYRIETVVTHTPTNKLSRHSVAVHRDLLLHRNLPDHTSIMYQANQDALHAYVLDAVLRVFDHG